MSSMVKDKNMKRRSGNKGETVMLWVPRQLKRDMRKSAKNSMLSLSAWIRLAIKEKLEKG